MPLEFFEIFRELFEVQFIGDTALMALILLISVIILLMFLSSSKEVLFLIPLPMFIAIGSMANIVWISTVSYILAGIYFANIVLAIFNRDKI